MRDKVRLIDVITDFQLLGCPDCGVEFFIPKDLWGASKYAGTNFFCPLGHNLVYKENAQALLS